MKRARKVVAGDLNHDGVSDLAVLYTIEGAGGGNNYTQYLAVVRFDVRRDNLLRTTHTVVGGKGNRAAPTGIESGDNVIFLTTLGYGPHDAMCCPSIKGSARFVLADGKLVSQPPPPSPKLRQ